jgi:hypothetical protein
MRAGEAGLDRLPAVPPTSRPLPRFIAEPPHELEPYGRWAERLAAEFTVACAEIEGDLEPPDPATIVWYPERTYAGRIYVPAIAPAGEGLEFFGHVSLARDEGEDARDFRATADYTDEIAALNPQWKIDLNDDVIGRWRGPGEASGEITLVWGEPLAPGGVAVTADLGGETVDQFLLAQGERFTMVALDAVTGLGVDDLYLEVKLWNRRGQPVASESLYESESD